jgi:NADH:ubiquinone oxidoreductase subunit 3 (subunit A)
MAKKKKKKKLKVGRLVLFIVLLLLIVVLAVAVVSLLLGRDKGSESTGENETTKATQAPTTTAYIEPTTSSLGQLGYESGVIASDKDSLQKQVDEMFSKAADGYAELEYENSANSTDGQNFTCYVANSKSNKYDMFITLYEDSTFTNQIYLSGLISPGSAIDHFTLSKTLDEGSHDCVLVMTQVADDHSTMVAQVSYTLTLAVTK